MDGLWKIFVVYGGLDDIFFLCCCGLKYLIEVMKFFYIVLDFVGIYLVFFCLFKSNWYLFGMEWGRLLEILFIFCNNVLLLVLSFLCFLDLLKIFGRLVKVVLRSFNEGILCE